MHAETRALFTNLARICAPEVNRALLSALDRRSHTPDRPAANGLLVANLARRAGDLAAARRAFAEHLDRPLPPEVAIPPGLMSSDGLAVAPLVAIDGFLGPEQMATLHHRTCAIEGRFRHAKVGSLVGAKNRDKRETLVTYEFDGLLEVFADYIDAHVPQLADALGIGGLMVERTEMKITCHLDGGFFGAHSDNQAAFSEPGRAITWLYYFGDAQPRHQGGELYLFDSDIANDRGSTAWPTRIEPRPDRFVAFPSWFHHAVAPTVLPEGGFAHGRFAAGGHVRKMADSARAWWE